MQDLKRELKQDLEDWKARLARLSLKGQEAKLDVEQKRREALREFEESERKAREKIESLSHKAGKEFTAVVGSLKAGWDELRRTYDTLRQ